MNEPHMDPRPLVNLISGRGLEAWREAFQNEAHAAGIELEISYGVPTDNPGVRVDLSSSLHVGRMTVWESGACELEALEVPTGRAVLATHHELMSEQAVRDEFLALLRFMKSAIQDPAGRPTMGSS